MLLGLGPKLLWHGLRHGRISLVAMALDLLVPPVALVAVLLMLVWLAALCLTLWGGIVHLGPLWLASALLLLFCLSLLRAWWGWGRDLVAGHEWPRLFGYLWATLPVFGAFLVRRQKDWVRTERK